MSMMFETLERMEKDNGEVSEKFAEMWSLVNEGLPVAEKPAAAVPLPVAARPQFTLPKLTLPKLKLPSAGELWTFVKGKIQIPNRPAFVTPLLAALVIGVVIPRIHAPNVGPLARSISHGWSQVREAVSYHPPVALDVDFRSAQNNDWVGRGDRDAASWSFDNAGFAHPGKLALYRPSIGLADYQMQFQGMIDRKALSWVVRAADFDNYYVVKLHVVKPGPTPSVAVTRYAVINGKIQNRVTTPLISEGRADTIYHVRLDVHESNFALAVQDQQVASWSEPALPRGGIGFFSDDNAKSSVIGVKVIGEHHSLGSLFASALIH